VKKQWLLIAAVSIAGWYVLQTRQHLNTPPSIASRSRAAGSPATQLPSIPARDATGRSAQDELGRAFATRGSNIQVTGSGTVVRVLADDKQGARHQRFLLRLTSGQIVMIAHNIDLAPRVEALRAGETIDFSGEYEWNERGGIVHWTHRDPDARHAPGWLRRNDRTYQ
jgi:hypothetical protein